MRFPLHGVTARAGATLDAAVAAAVVASQKRRPTRIERLSHEARLAEFALVRDAYGERRFLEEPDTFFSPPAPVELRLVAAATRLREATVLDASWPSPHAPHLPEIEGRYADAYNGVAHARLYLHREPRPAVMVVHGYLTGHFAFEERVWPLAWLHHRLGLDVAVFTLPFHGLRADPTRRGPPPFPAADPRLTVEAFRHAVGDLRVLLRWLRERGSPEVGVIGMSLGGYTVSLLATVESQLAFLVPMIPLASIADLARDTGRLGRGPERDVQHRLYDEAHRVVSPLARPSRVAPEAVLVIGAAGDRITHVRHAERLAAHFAAPLVTYPGSHLVQIGIGSCWRSVASLLEARGIAAPRAPMAGGAPRASGFFRRAVPEVRRGVG